MIRYNNIAPKYIYYLGLILNLTILIFISWAYEQTIHLAELEPILIIGVLASIYTLLFILYINKAIYLKIDYEKKVIQYGSIFFKNEVDKSEIHEIKRLHFFSSVFKIKISDKSYYFYSLQSDLNKLKPLLGSNLNN